MTKAAAEKFVERLHFDWKKVGLIMSALNWRWHSLRGIPRVPSTVEMRQVVAGLVHDLSRPLTINGRKTYGLETATGGFHVRRYLNEDGVAEISVEFVVESSHDTIWE